MNKLLIILKKELRELFRDKKSLSMMLIVPILIPAVVLGMSALFEMNTNKKITEYNKIGFSYELTDTEKEIAKQLEIEIIEKTEDELKEEYDNGNINLYITKEDNKYILNGNEEENTTYASNLMHTFYQTYKEYLQTNYLTENNIDAKEVTNIIEVEENITIKENFYKKYITTYAFLFIIMAITTSATYPSTDATAGEKERGTLETLMTFPIKSKDIIIGKFLSVSLSSMITGIISLLLMCGSLLIANKQFDIYEGIDLSMSLTSILFACIVIIGYSLLISGLCIAIASKSKTFKEAQSALTPVTFISFFPGMIAFMINIKSSAVLSIVPFLNYTLLFDDIASGTVNALNIILMIVSSIVYISLVLSVIIKQYKSEKVLF